MSANVQAWLSDGVVKEMKDLIRWKIKPDKQGRWKFRENDNSIIILCDETPIERAPSVQILDFINREHSRMALVTDYARVVTAKFSQLAITEYREIEGRELSDLRSGDIIQITALEIQLFTSQIDTERLMLLIHGFSSNGAGHRRDIKIPHLIESSRIQDAMEYLGLAPLSRSESSPLKTQVVEEHDRVDEPADGERPAFASQENSPVRTSPLFASQVAPHAQAGHKQFHDREDAQNNNNNNPLLVLLQRQRGFSSVQNDTHHKNAMDERGVEDDIKVASTDYQERIALLPAVNETDKDRAEDGIYGTTIASQMPTAPLPVVSNINGCDAEDDVSHGSSCLPKRIASSPLRNASKRRAPLPAANEPFFAFAETPWASNGPDEAQRRLLANESSWQYPDTGDPLERINLPIEILVSIQRDMNIAESQPKAYAEPSSSSNVTETQKSTKTTENDEEYDDSDEDMSSSDEPIADWSESEEARSPSPRSPHRAAEPDDSSAADENSPTRRPRPILNHTL